MAKELRHIDITHHPELLEIVREAETANEPVVLRRESEDVAILRPVKRSARRRIPHRKPFTMDDPIWNLAGAGASGLGDVSENKHKYLAEAYLSHTDKASTGTTTRTSPSPMRPALP